MVRSQVLYPAELRALSLKICIIAIFIPINGKTSKIVVKKTRGSNDQADLENELGGVVMMRVSLGVFCVLEGFLAVL